MNAIIPFFRGRDHGSRRSVRRTANRRRSIMLVEALEGRQLLSGMTFPVTDTADTPGSATDVTLRYAITQANAIPNSTIEFNLGETGNDWTRLSDDAVTTDGMPVVYYTFALNSPLPPITSAVTIDGTSENQWEEASTANQPLIEIDGANLTSSTTPTVGLTITAGSVTVDGLSIVGFNGGGVEITGSACEFDTVETSWIGINPDGDSGSNSSFGVEVTDGAKSNTIGGTIGADPSGGTAAPDDVISSNAGPGVLINGTSNNLVEGDYIGTDASGTEDEGNTANGVLIEGVSSHNTVGGTIAGSANTIGFNGSSSSNPQNGVEISGSSDNVVEGNYIGTDTGADNLINGGDGVLINGGATANTIGGSTPAALNLISNNGTNGVEISGLGTESNLVEGNYLGTDNSGEASTGDDSSSGNGNDGAVIDNGATFNTVGGTTAGALNVISGNHDNGVGLDSSNNVIEGNYIGLGADGITPVPNAFDGVIVHNNATNNTIGGSAQGASNIITGNNGNGVDISGSGTTGNVVSGNDIGTNSSGDIDSGNGNRHDGVVIQSGAASNTVGGTTAHAVNIIVGNGVGNLLNNVDINDASQNVVEGNDIGIDASGSTLVLNIGDGVIVQNGATANTIGGTLSGLIGGSSPFSMNVISGNGANGVELTSSGTESNLVEGNYLGTNSSGETPLGNGNDGVVVDNKATLNTVGGTTPGARNVISGNDENGVGLDSSSNTIEGNYIGLGANGNTTVANTFDGVIAHNDATNNTIGGSVVDAGNVISGNGGNGVNISGIGTTGNVVSGNDIGTNYAGDNVSGIGNRHDGVVIQSGAASNTVGGTTAHAVNIIVGNGVGNLLNNVDINDAADNVVEGNFIGIDANQTTMAPTVGDGVIVQNGAIANTIGGTLTGPFGGSAPFSINVISGNGANGVEISGSGTVSNLVEGNYLGTNSSGNLSLHNGNDGVVIDNGAFMNTVGGTTAGARNVISGNDDNGVGLDSSNNVIEGNYIGIEANGTTSLGNQFDGVIAHNGADNNTIGGSAAGAGNVISANQGNGVNISGTTGNVVEGNLIGTNYLGASGPGNAKDGVIIQSGASTNTVGGTTVHAGNTISGNGQNGVEINDSSNDLLEGNDIGTGLTSTIAVPNDGDGVDVDGGSQLNTIGGTVASAGNVISYNKAFGVLSESTDQTTVLSNSIYQNTSGGIGFTGTTQVPTITLSQLTTSATTTTVGVTIADASLFANVLIQFFSSPSGGQGATLIDSDTEMTTPTGTYNNGSLALSVAPTPGGVLTATVTNETVKLVTSAFSDALAVPAPPPPSNGPPPTASLVKKDTATEGNWIKAYGTQGYNVVGDAASYPSYATVTTTGTTNYTWAASTTDPRALQNPGGNGRLAATWYSSTSFTINVNLTDGQAHDIALYALDWSSSGRSEQIQISSAATGTVLDTETLSSFSGGEYVQWMVSGNVVIKVTNLMAGSNAVISGLFFDPPATTATNATASFVKQDTSTKGNWIGNYGIDGYNVVGDATSYPSYATVTTTGATTYTWAASTTDSRALQNPGGNGRLAATWYSSTSFTINVNLTDGQVHDIALYALDWSSSGRSEQIQITSAATGTVLDTETLSSFSGGEYLQWKVSGNVVIKVTNLFAGSNAVISGLFFDPPAITAPAPTPATASFVKLDAKTQGNWIGTYGHDGYNVVGDPTSYPGYAIVTPTGESSYTWAASTTDPRALQNPGGNGRLAETWYSTTSFAINVDLTDGQTHDVALYAMDWTDAGRTEQIQITSASTGAVLDTETLSNFSGGDYLQWAISGNVVITIKSTGGGSAVMSGLFFN